MTQLFQVYPRGDLVIRQGIVYFWSVRSILKIKTVEENNFNGLITVDHCI